VDYHVRGFNETFYPKWAESYEYILKKIKEEDDFYSDTPLILLNFGKTEKRRFCVSRKMNIEVLSKKSSRGKKY